MVKMTAAMCFRIFMAALYIEPHQLLMRKSVLREQINEAVKGAMKAQEKLKLSTLRLVNAAVKNADIEAQMAQKPALTDDDIVGVLGKMIKQRQDSVAAFEQGGRKELADQERSEIEV